MVELNLVVDEHPQENFEFEVIPPGRYRCLIKDTSQKLNSKGTGAILTVTLEIADGPFNRRLLWWRANVQHDNPATQKIGLASVAELCKCVGLAKLTHTEELHNQMVGVVVINEPHWQDASRLDSRAKSFVPASEIPAAGPTNPEVKNTTEDSPW